jgi:hypothetical protein
MMQVKPITQRAKCKYINMPATQEVTVDAGGKTPLNLDSSPMQKKGCGCGCGM